MRRPRHLSRVLRWLHLAVKGRVRLAAGGSPSAGMSTAEYAVGTIAACAFAAVLYKIVTSTQVFQLLGDLVTKALHAPF